MNVYSWRSQKSWDRCHDGNRWLPRLNIKGASVICSVTHKQKWGKVHLFVNNCEKRTIHDPYYIGSFRESGEITA